MRDDDPQWDRYLRFREHLRSDEAARAAYSALKRELAERFPTDRRSYTAAKAAFIREILARAEE